MEESIQGARKEIMASLSVNGNLAVQTFTRRICLRAYLSNTRNLKCMVLTSRK